MRHILTRLIAWFLAPQQHARDCICHIRADWHDRQGRPGFRARDY